MARKVIRYFQIDEAARRNGPLPLVPNVSPLAVAFTLGYSLTMSSTPGRVALGKVKARELKAFRAGRTRKRDDPALTLATDPRSSVLPNNRLRFV